LNETGLEEWFHGSSTKEQDVTIAVTEKSDVPGTLHWPTEPTGLKAGTVFSAIYNIGDVILAMAPLFFMCRYDKDE